MSDDFMARYRELVEAATVEEAVALQKKLAHFVVISPLPSTLLILGAADLAYIRGKNDKNEVTAPTYVAVVITFSWPDLSLLEKAVHIGKVDFPYIPGLLSFREVPPIFRAWEKLREKPDVFLCDGQGIAHPRGIGLATHLGLLLDIPTVGCAKTRLWGHHEELPPQKGSRVPLYANGQPIGIVYRSRTGVKPLYISPGHMADISSSVTLVEKCLGRYRIPEPIRAAHRLAKQVKLTFASDNP